MTTLETQKKPSYFYKMRTSTIRLQCIFFLQKIRQFCHTYTKVFFYYSQRKMIHQHFQAIGAVCCCFHSFEQEHVNTRRQQVKYNGT